MCVHKNLWYGALASHASRSAAARRYAAAASSSSTKRPRYLRLPPMVIVACHLPSALFHVTPLCSDEVFRSGAASLAALSHSE